MKTKDCTKDSFLMVLGLLSPRKFAPNPNSNTNRKLNPNPNRGSFPRGAIVRTPFSITLQIHRVYLYQKRDSETYVFFVNSAKFLITLFKEPCGRLLLHKHSFCLLSYQRAFVFSKAMSRIFFG